MAVPEKFQITFTCGHIETKDLSTTPAGKRKARAFGMGKNFVCATCFKAKGKAELEKQNRQQLVDAQSFEEEHAIPEIDGSEKQISWATRVRYEVLTEIMDSEDTDSHQRTANNVLEIAKNIPKAGWWLDNCTDKSLTVADLIELITTAVDDVEDRETCQLENPF